MRYMQECVSKKKIGSGTGMKYARNVTVILHQLQYMILLIMHASVLSISWHRCVCALREVTGSASTSSQMLLLLWTMAIVGHRKGAG